MQKPCNKLTDNYGYPNGKLWEPCDKKSGKMKSLELSFDFKDFYLGYKDKVNFISFKTNDEKKKRQKLINETVLKIAEINGNEYHALTGNYIGIINFGDKKKTSVQIESRFDNTFLSHMLNYFNDIFVIDGGDSFNRSKEGQSDNVIQYILCHMFVRSLDKASGILGLPKMYQQQLSVGYNVRGKIDIKHLVNKNIPLRGKLHSHYAERTEVREIIDVLYTATHKVLGIYPKMIIGNTLSLYHFLKEKRSSKFVSKETISKAKQHKALVNPMYQPYKQVLEYAHLIIDYLDNLQHSNKDNIRSYSYLIDVAELFEIYIEKVLRRGLAEKGWTVMPQVEAEVYKNTFFSRKLKPDIVLEKDNKVVVFDVKYKRMNYDGKNRYGMGDLDRNDFFQIHTYMAYYQGLENKNLIGGGLLYPIEGTLQNGESHSSDWLGNEGFFVINGINLSGITEAQNKMEKILDEENEFIKRIGDLLGE